MTNKQEVVQIHAQMTIAEILGLFPFKAQKLAQEITNAGLHCVGCNAATYETLEMGMLGHGKTPEEIQTLVDRLNVLLAEKIDATTISFTPRGAAKFLKILEEEGKQGYALRFGDQMAGCSGFEYVLDFSEKANPDDAVFVSHGIEIHVHQASLPRLIGAEIDYQESLHNSGFKITNPNVRSSCACSSSHGY